MPQLGTRAIPHSGHPLVRFVYEQLRERRVRQSDVLATAGLAQSTLHKWRRQTPSVGNLEAVLNVLGFELRAIPRD